MSFAAQWPGVTEFDTVESNHAEAAADACLARLVRQWVSLSESVVAQAPPGSDDAARTGWWPPVLELAAIDGELVAPEPPPSAVGHRRDLPRRHRRTQARLDSWLAAAIHADCRATKPGHPLVARFRTSSLQFVAFSTTKIPDDVKDLCHELVDLSRSKHVRAADSGKHRN